MRKIKILDKEFKVFIKSTEIQRAVASVAECINHDFQGKEIVFISVLNGSFMFTTDLLKKIIPQCTVSFVKLSSYQGDASTGKVKQLIGLAEDLEGKNVILLEDIIDTGITIEALVGQLRALKVADLRIATLLFKPQAYTKNLKIDYVGLEIPNDFIVGYGLDYNGYGRNYEHIYVVNEHIVPAVKEKEQGVLSNS
jgi:hypoxanthine phosphoribosyltransferase